MKMTLKSVALAIIVVAGMSVAAATEHQDAKRAVLVTGATSGIGLAIAQKLAASGFHVYAGARKTSDIRRLDALDNISAVRLDVTNPADIAAAKEFVESQGRGLYGIVNNAGVAVFLSMDEVSEDDIDWVFDVNVYGPYRINKAFSPMLKASSGRTTLIGSISGYVAGSNSGTYAMSKFATEGYTDAFAAEMAEFDVHVSIIEPGGYKSKIREKVALHAMGKLSDEKLTLSDAEKATLEEMVAANASLKEPDEVAEAALHVMTSDRPKRRYMVTPNEEQATQTIRAALGKVAQLNRGQPYEYSRDELIEMLDAALVAEY